VERAAARRGVARVEEIEHRHVELVVAQRGDVVLGRREVDGDELRVREAISKALTSWPKIWSLPAVRDTCAVKRTRTSQPGGGEMSSQPRATR
jgi:hypothetical protein